MTRDEILESYDVRGGTIRSPGKFEAEPIFAPYFWDASLDGCAEELDGMTDGCGEYVALAEVSPEDRAAWPEIGADTAFVMIAESQQGFVSVSELTSEEADELRAEYAEHDSDCPCSDCELRRAESD